MGRKEELIGKIKRLMDKPEYIRDIGTAAHIDHGKTTLSDNLLAGAGMISEELAGTQLYLDYDEQEQTRGITINAANASMVHEYGGKEYLINLIDTPGHVDFGGDVTRAMRALDGVIIVICAVEGVMPQTETVIRQALKERAKPILFINKVDRLITELKLSPEEMQKKLKNIIIESNRLIRKFAPSELKEKWQCRVEDGSVAFGSATQKWATSAPFMERTGVSFKQIYEYTKEGKIKELAKLTPLHEVLLDMVVKHLPNPVDAQEYRIPTIWGGCVETDVGKAMVSCDRNGPLAVMVTKIIMDPHAGEIAIGRVYGGTVKKGQEVGIVGWPKEYGVQQVAISIGADRLPVDELVAGNIVALSGIKDAISGSTVTTTEMAPFERIVHYSEPVVTVAIEAKHTKDLPKLIDVLRSIVKADPSLQVEINQETGEHLLSGMGELHLEIAGYRIKHEYGVDIQASPPIVVYRECVEGSGGPFEGKSPNKHNKFYLTVEPLEEEIAGAIKKGELDIKDKKEKGRRLRELGMEKKESKGIVAMHGTNVFLNMTKGKQYLHETMELVIKGFKEAMERGPLAEEKTASLKVKLVDVKLHEDSIHRGPAQVIPAVRRAIHGAMCQARRILLEPKQKVFINLPQDLMGNATKEMQQRRARIESIDQEDEIATIRAVAPVAEMFGFASDIRSATTGRALWSAEHAGFEKLPEHLENEVIKKIRTRKGLKPEPYAEGYYRD